MTRSRLIPTEICPSVSRSALSIKEVRSDFKSILSSQSKLVVAGDARSDPTKLMTAKFLPKFRIDLFTTRFYFSNVFQIPELRFFVAFVVQQQRTRRGTLKPDRFSIFPRIIYKDLSLAWRSASHFSDESGDIWVGKGDVRDEIHDGFEMVVSDESTTDLPLEMQTAVEGLLSVSGIAVNGKARNGKGVMDLVLRRAPDDRVEPYSDFIKPRQEAAANRKNLINDAKPIARFTRENDPTSLKMMKGFQPDFVDGILERGKSKSKLYGGTLHRFRILSVNRKVHYYFIAGSRHVWVFPPQALTTELSSYGVRTVDVEAADDLFIPGYEYHHYEETENGEELYSQIPPGFAGEVCPADDAKADASPWLDKIPLIQEFRKKVLNQ